MRIRTLALGATLISAALGTAFALQTSEPEREISNYQGTYTCHPEAVYDPQSIEGVQAIVKDALIRDKKVMTGNRKFASQIDAACAGDDQVQLTLKNMDKIVHFDAANKRVTVEAGMRFNDLNDFLREQGYAINMVTELAIFTVGGMLGSGTHGSTLDKPSNMLADYVTELKVVDGQGDVRVLNGDLLNAARVNLGVLGVVVEVTLAIEEAFKVKAEVTGYRDDSGLEDVVLDIARSNYSANIAWFPGLGRYTTTLYNPVPLETQGEAYNAQADVSDAEEFFFGLLFNAAHEFPGTGLQCLAAVARYNARAKSYFRDSNTGKKVSEPIGYSDQMQYFKCKDPNKCIWDRLPIALQEVAIDIERLPDWIRDVREIVAAHPRTCFPLNGIYFRFGQASDSYIGMSAGRETAFVGIEYTLRQEGKKEPKNYFVNLEIEQMSLRKYDARPHWGKNSVAIFEEMPSRFPMWQEFLQAKAELDPYNVFTNPFWERVSGDIPMDDYLTPGCNVRGECYCQTDEHCQSGTQCQAGLYFTDARICR
ncbi:D-arabinono-1,4-lactone oxidase [Vibrio coralliilyticus]|uniref:D-arabinono-1,4-lactone oxidase n=1 Tax=Vibrio coralliilyticus TaxID=190893 RepID=UPI00155FBF8A|nr:D-arabinono-1,4-lactone oxidase [Vibrio coralliilyticus]NRF33146.1 FAD-binding protein [Vibrio coralliilyticus]NRF53456.1 FAD-binding protein [Vibrio coralliilyticus]NRG05591.1 FAD-binding protein [Vibrio coralliilyticus]